MTVDDKLYDWTGGAVPSEKFDTAKAAGCIGKSILIGVTYLNAEDEPERQLSMHGVIENATLEGVMVALRGTPDGESWNIPSNLDSISPLEQGTYKLRNTDEV